MKVRRLVGNAFHSVLHRLPPRAFCVAARVELRLRDSDSRFLVHGGLIHGVRTSTAEILLPSALRASVYLGGVSHRLRHIFSRYHLENLPTTSIRTVVDCGAHIGELLLALQAFSDADVKRYVAFEPDRSCHGPLMHNCRPVEIRTVALSDQSGTGCLLSASDTGDSHLLTSQGELAGIVRQGRTQVVLVSTLDELLVQETSLIVDLLKVEAEGHEPEVLAGGLSLLRRVRYVALDAGPERDGRNTLAECTDLLYKSGFSLVAFNHLEYTALFANEQMTKQDAA